MAKWIFFGSMAAGFAPNQQLIHSVEWQRGITYDQDIDMAKNCSNGKRQTAGFISS